MQRRFALIKHQHSMSDLSGFSLSGLANNDLLKYNSTTGVWQNVTVAVVNALFDHGTLAGLGDDDHTQYHNDARGDARYSLLGHNHDSAYISIVGSPTTGNFPTLTAGGELANSVYGPTSFATPGDLSAYLPLAGGTLTGDLSISSTSPILNVIETDGAADEKNWRLFASGGNLALSARSDDGLSSTSLMTVIRNGLTLDSVTWLTTGTIIGTGASASVSGMNRYLSVSSATNAHVVGIECYVGEGTGNQRVWMFCDDNTNYVGFDFTYSAGLNAFEMRRAGTAWLSLNAGGTAVTINPTLTTPNLSASEIGFKGIPQNSQTTNYTLVLTDAGKHIYKGSGGTVTMTIPANASVAFPIGTAVTFINDDTENMTIAITTDTLVLSPGGTTGSRTLAQYGMATAIKVTSTRWFISGTGLT